MREPARLIDDPETAEALRAALDAGRAEAPSASQLASLAGRLGPLLGPGGGGGGADGGGLGDPGAGGALGAGGAGLKVAGGLLAAAAVVGLSIAAWPSERPDAPPERTAEVAEPTETAVAEPAPELPEGLDPPAPVAPSVRPTARDRAPSFERDPGAELALIERAQRRLSTSPSEALTLTAEHARRFGEGALGQEREVIAIDALSRLGRTDEARRRADAFRRSHPRSAHTRRLDVLLGGREGP